MKTTMLSIAVHAAGVTGHNKVGKGVVAGSWLDLRTWLVILNALSSFQIGSGAFNTFEELWLVFFHESFDPEHAGETMISYSRSSGSSAIVIKST